MIRPPGAAEIADQIGDAVPVIYGADLTHPVAYRWKTQINENGKLPAFSSSLPEASHNEIRGVGGLAKHRLACAAPPRPTPISTPASAGALR